MGFPWFPGTSGPVVGQRGLLVQACHSLVATSYGIKPFAIDHSTTLSSCVLVCTNMVYDKSVANVRKDWKPLWSDEVRNENSIRALCFDMGLPRLLKVGDVLRVTRDSAA